jgi:glycosyltransferase involved in cell wall biosynthesis
MIITYIADARSIHTRRWCEYIAGLGHQVHLVSFKPYQDHSAGFVLHHLEFKHQKSARGLEYFYRARQAVRAILQSIQPDVLHAHYVQGPGHLGLLSGWRPLVVTAWGSDIYRHNHYSLAGRLLSRLTMRQADLLTCDSQDLKQAMVRLGAPASRIKVIQFGIDTEHFKPGLDTAAMRKQLGVEEYWPIIVSPRAMQPVYNIDVLVQCLNDIRREFPRSMLLIKDTSVDTAYREKVVSLIDSLKLKQHVKFVGYTPYGDMAYLYNLADVVVSMAKSDGTPMSVLEAMACGRPVVASDLPSLREWITTNENGYLVDPADSKEITASICRGVMLEDEVKQQWAKRNRLIILERGDQRENMARMEYYYQMLSKQKGSNLAAG